MDDTQVYETDTAIRPLARLRQDSVRRFLSASEVAQYVGVPKEEVLGWIYYGELKANYMPHGRFRISFDDLLGFLQKNDMSI